MYEISNNRKVVSIMPGISQVDWSLKAYPLQNTIISGLTGSGKDTLINSIIMHLIQFGKPNDLIIEYYDELPSQWLNENRSMPQFKTQLKTWHESWNTVQRLEALLQYIYNLRTVYIPDANGDYEELPNKYHLVILNTLEYLYKYKDKDYINTLVSDIMELGPKYGIYTIVCTQGYDLPDCILDKCDLRLATRLRERESVKILGCDIAAREIEKSGFVWVYDRTEDYLRVRLEVKFYPNSFIGKVCKYNSTNKYENDSYDTFVEDYMDNFPTMCNQLEVDMCCAAGHKVEIESHDYDDMIKQFVYTLASH